MKSLFGRIREFLHQEKQHRHLLTKEGEKLSGIPWEEYPRPQLRRDSYLNLNGMWDFAITGKRHIPDEFPMQIMVPFPPESLLSGVQIIPGKYDYLYYRRKFSVPADFIKDKILLHFGAVDQIAEVYLNGEKLITHVGGYLPFTVDITPHMEEENTLVVKVKDTLNHMLPYGKQRRKRGGMWYTPVSGIWQTVWLESVSNDYIRGIKIKPALDSVTMYIDTSASVKEIKINTQYGKLQKVFHGNAITILINDPVVWTPENPYLYEFQITTPGDRITSYFALRTLSVRNVNGVARLCLNNEPYFFHGLLDQGYYSDGIYLPASVDGFYNDIMTMKELGFNTLRKHIKIEPAWYYYLCDRLGMVVFQDMVNNGHYSFLRDTALPTMGLVTVDDTMLFHGKRVKKYFKLFAEETIRYLYNFPCICYWTIFNEGWGQFESDKMYEQFKKWDDSRFIDSTSGWFQQKLNDVQSRHIYFVPIFLKNDGRPMVLSEFGGYSYKLEEHSFNQKSTYGYGFYKERTEFQKAVQDIYLDGVAPWIHQGLCGSVYTQLSDVEDETNGLLTYDRKVLKVEKEDMLAIARRLEEALHTTGSESTDQGRG